MSRPASTLLRRAGVAAAMVLAAVAVHAQRADSPECIAKSRQLGVPKELVSALIVLQANMPSPFAEITCTVKPEVRFSYHRGGWLTDENFEVKGKRTVRVWMVRQQTGDPNLVLLVPTRFAVNGEKTDVDRVTARTMSLNLAMAVNNK